MVQIHRGRRKRGKAPVRMGDPLRLIIVNFPAPVKSGGPGCQGWHRGCIFPGRRFKMHPIDRPMLRKGSTRRRIGAASILCLLIPLVSLQCSPDPIPQERGKGAFTRPGKAFPEERQRTMCRGDRDCGSGFRCLKISPAMAACVPVVSEDRSLTRPPAPKARLMGLFRKGAP